jgi:hypothetical protein
LYDLINRLLEGRLSDADADRLGVWLSVDEEAQAIYLQAMRLHAELTLAYGDEDSVDSPPPIPDVFSLDRLSGDAREPVAAPVTKAEQANPSSRRVRSAGSKQRGRFRAFCRRFVFASLAMLLTVVAVFGSETIVNGVLALRRAAIADKRGGMLAAGAERSLYAGPNRQLGTRRIGSGRSDGVALASIFLFPLPALNDLEQIEAAQIEWTCKAKDNNPTFSVDLYGLGYVSPPETKRLGFWEGREDRSLRGKYGMAGPSDRTVELIKRGAMVSRTTCGRIKIESRNLVSFLQSLYADGAKQGDFAVFRLNADRPTSRISRETGYAVVHPPVQAGITQPEDLPALLLSVKSRTLADEPVVAEAAMAAQSIAAHWSSGLVRSSNNVVQIGSNGDGVRRIGSSYADGESLVNVLVFSLPSEEKLGSLHSARLEWTCISKDNDPKFAVDLYGLGYVRGQSYGGPCFWEGPPDESSPADYGLDGAPERRVTLVARGVMNPAIPCRRMTVENSALVDFLRSVYADGAREGDLVIFRLNADRPTQGLRRSTGYNIAHAPEIPGRTTPADLPVLLMTFN